MNNITHFVQSIYSQIGPWQLAKEIAKEKGETFDTAYPKAWADKAREIGIDTRGFIWVYKKGDWSGKPIHVDTYICNHIRSKCLHDDTDTNIIKLAELADFYKEYASFIEA